MNNSDRCPWPGDLQLMIQYHDTEWGAPLHDDGKHFEFLVLDGAQAGLSWYPDALVPKFAQDSHGHEVIHANDRSWMEAGREQLAGRLTSALEAICSGHGVGFRPRRPTRNGF